MEEHFSVSYSEAAGVKVYTQGEEYSVSDWSLGW